MTTTTNTSVTTAQRRLSEMLHNIGNLGSISPKRKQVKQARATVSTALSGVRLALELVHPALSLGRKPQGLVSIAAESRRVPGSACFWSLLPLVAVHHVSADATAAAAVPAAGAVAGTPVRVAGALWHLRHELRMQEMNFHATAALAQPQRISSRPRCC